MRIFFVAVVAIGAALCGSAHAAPEQAPLFLGFSFGMVSDRSDERTLWSDGFSVGISLSRPAGDRWLLGVSGTQARWSMNQFEIERRLIPDEAELVAFIGRGDSAVYGLNGFARFQLLGIGERGGLHAQLSVGGAVSTARLQAEAEWSVSGSPHGSENSQLDIDETQFGVGAGAAGVVSFDLGFDSLVDLGLGYDVNAVGDEVVHYWVAGLSFRVNLRAPWSADGEEEEDSE